MQKEYAEYLLKKTKEDYNLIAETFSQTRYSIWPELTFFRKYVKERERILDLGCGNGRLFELFKNRNVEYFGVDNVEKLIEIARKKYPEAKFLVGDALNLPFPDNYFDKVFSIAVFHHIPSGEFRLQFLKEVRRVLKQEGFLILTIWGLWRRATSLKLLTKFTIFKIFGKSGLDFKDIFIPWQKTIDRYLHCFTKKELKNITKRAGFKIKEMGIFRRGETKNYNIYLITEK